MDVVRAVLRRSRPDELGRVRGDLRNDAVRKRGVEIDGARHLLRGDVDGRRDDRGIRRARCAVIAERLSSRAPKATPRSGTVTSSCKSTVTTSSETENDTTTSDPFSCALMLDTSAGAASSASIAGASTYPRSVFCTSVVIQLPSLRAAHGDGAAVMGERRTRLKRGVHDIARLLGAVTIDAQRSMLHGGDERCGGSEERRHVVSFWANVSRFTMSPSWPSTTTAAPSSTRTS